MELVFIARAIKRYRWVAMAFVALGLVAGYLVAPGRGEVYETDAWVLVSSPNQPVGASATDRDVQNQLVLLGSSALAAQVAEQVAGMGTFDIEQATTFEQVPGSDVVQVIVRAGSPDQAQQVANTYVETFIAALQDQLDAQPGSNLESIDENIEALEAELDAVNERIEAVLAPYFEAATTPDTPGILPALDQVAPALASRRQTLTTQYSELVRLRADIEVSRAQERLGTRVVQQAALPSDPEAQRPSLLLAAGPLMGLVVGALAAIGLARISPRVLDAEEIARALGRPIAGRLPKRRPVGPHELLAEPLPQEFRATIHELSVRAEASGALGRSLTVMVGATERGAGSTTVAVALASRFASEGAEVALIDLDSAHRQLSGMLGESLSGVELLLDGATDTDTPARSRSSTGHDVLTDTDIPRVSFAGLGPDVDSYQLRRKDVPDLVERARSAAQIVVFDAGMVMDSASSLELASLVDAVVLCVPEKRQRSAVLEVIGRHLAGVSGVVLPVLTQLPGSSPGLRRDRPARSDTQVGEPDAEVPVERSWPGRPGRPAPSSRR